MEEQFVYKEQYSHPTSICLNVTDDCNLACRYCFVIQKPHYMTLDLAKDAVRWVINNLNWHKKHGLINDNDTATVTYFGGEPTLMWDQIIVPLTRWAFEEYPKQIHFTITTNGTLLNDERIKFMYAYNFSPLLSIDGAYETQEYNRPCKDPNLSSADLQYKNIPTLLKYFPDITFRSTIDEHTVSHTFENYIFAQWLGFKHIFMMPNCRSPWKEENLKILSNEFEKIYNYMIEYFEKNEMPPISFSCINDSFKQIKNYNLSILNNYDDKKHKKSITRCGLGTTGCAIGYNGEIYACQEQNSKENNSYFHIGNIYDGIDIHKHYDFLYEYFNSELICGDKPEYCENCLLSSICDSLHCPSMNYDLFKKFGHETYVYCYWQRTLFEQAVKTLDYLEKNDIFNYYLQSFCGYDFLRKEG